MIKPKFILTFSVILLVIFSIYERNHPRPDLAVTDEKYFQKLNQSNEYRPPYQNEIISINPTSNFIVQVDPNAKEIIISFKYKCIPNCEELWVTIPTLDPNNPLDFLASHPVFSMYPQSRISNDVYSLYQKEVFYPSIEAFAKNIPLDEIWTENSLIASNTPGLNLKYLKHNIPQSEPKYILTTFVKPRIFIDWFEFAKRLDVSNITLDNNHQFIVSLEHYSHNKTDTKLFITKPIVERAQ